jgi:hypothetical protein
LPLTFSRRHGDPSRPWNHFSIDLEKADGSEYLHYEGNWRDIFQNWEALAVAFPEYIESFVAKFINASTADGHNPYRICRRGIGWQVLEPGVPWSNIGYWGDHQVGYLLRLLELSHNYHPGKLGEWLDRDIFVYADVPYRIKPYRELLRDPRESVEYDDDRAQAVAKRVADIGADGKLITLGNASIFRVNLLEKLLISALARIGNLVPGGGIWMNTQRPEVPETLLARAERTAPWARGNELRRLGGTCSVFRGYRRGSGEPHNAARGIRRCLCAKVIHGRDGGNQRSIPRPHLPRFLR